jgi:hypothetical protein
MQMRTISRFEAHVSHNYVTFYVQTITIFVVKYASEFVLANTRVFDFVLKSLAKLFISFTIQEAVCFRFEEPIWSLCRVGKCLEG